MNISNAVTGNIHSKTGSKSYETERRLIIDVNTVFHRHILRKVIEKVGCS